VACFLFTWRDGDLSKRPVKLPKASNVLDAVQCYAVSRNTMPCGTVQCCAVLCYGAVLCLLWRFTFLAASFLRRCSCCGLLAVRETLLFACAALGDSGSCIRATVFG
jgi:hypothetical protein